MIVCPSQWLGCQLVDTWPCGMLLMYSVDPWPCGYVADVDVSVCVKFRFMRNRIHNY